MIRSILAIAKLLAIAALSSACAGASGTAGPTATSPATPGPPLSHAELRYRIIDTFGPIWYCDPDLFPIARADEQQLAVQRFGEVEADRDAFTAILTHLDIAPGTAFTDEQKLTIYRAWKQLNAIQLAPVGQPGYQFDYINMPAAGATEGRRTAGTIDERGTIAIDQQAPSGQPPCPICLARGTRIATPTGDLAVEEVRVGMTVWGIGADGRRQAVTVRQVGRTPVPSTHEVIRLVLDDGRVLRASPGHPLLDGRVMADLRARDVVDGATVVSANLEPYDGGFTFDLLTDAPGGGYIADGIPLGSTLAVLGVRH